MDLSFVRIETFFEKSFIENDEENNGNDKNDYVYFICFLFIMHNYRRNFSIKIERNRIKKLKFRLKHFILFFYFYQ